MAQTPFLEQFRLARNASVPLFVVRTADQQASMRSIIELSGNDKAGTVTLFQWDSMRGVQALTKESARLLPSITPSQDKGGLEALQNPVNMLEQAHNLPKHGILFLLNGHLFLKDPVVVQGICNLRDPLKETRRALVLLCPEITVPPEFAHDTVVLDEPLPDTTQLGGLVYQCYTNAGLAKPKEDVVSKAVDAGCGLSSFSFEQALATSIRRSGLDMNMLWDRKRQQIEQTPGLSVWKGGETFADIGGCNNIKSFLTQVLKGKAQPRAIVFIDEIEKAVAGSQGDVNGTSQALLEVLLTFMQDKKATGCLFIGPPGAAKSAMAKAAGNEAGIPTISFDINGTRGSLQGETEHNMRHCLKVIDAVSQERALFIATCNSIGSLPPELRRRFNFGTFFFDLPDAEERKAIWKLYEKQYDMSGKHPDDTGWTGAEIKQCCDLAWRLDCSFVEASKYIVPVSISAKNQIDRLRTEASGRFTSASNPGIYLSEHTGAMVATVGSGRRKVEVE